MQKVIRLRRPDIAEGFAFFARANTVRVESANDLKFHRQKCDVPVGAVYQPCIISHTSTGGTKQANACAAEGNQLTSNHGALLSFTKEALVAAVTECSQTWCQTA